MPDAAARVAELTPPLRTRPEWKALAAHYEAVRDLHLRDLFAKDPARGERLTVEAAGLYPVSYTHLTLPTIYSV